MLEKTRQGKPISAVLPALATGQETSPARSSKKPPVGNGKATGLHVVPAPESLAQRPMTIEEAVKEAESRDQQVFVFRDLAGDVKVLHCAGDGIVRLTEVS